jgi:hypothetical protein
MSELLPGKIAQRVLLRAPADKTKCDERNAYFHKDIGELIDQDRIAFSQIRLVGKKAVSILAELIAIHRETFKFTTMLQPAAEDLKASDEVALIGRVVDAIHNDVKARRKLLAMFPAPTP